VRVFRCCRQEQGFHAGELPIHQGDAALVAVIGAVAQAAHDEGRAHTLAEIDRKSAEGNHFHQRLPSEGLSHPRQPLLLAEERLLRGVHADSNHDLAEQGQRAPHDAHVPDGDRVEGAGEDSDGGGHAEAGCAD
jgi:hypothetical protein